MSANSEESFDGLLTQAMMEPIGAVRRFSTSSTTSSKVALLLLILISLRIVF